MSLYQCLTWGFIRDLDSFLWGQEPTRRIKKVFKFSPNQKAIHFDTTNPSKLEQLEELCHCLQEPNCHSNQPAHSNHQGT